MKTHLPTNQLVTFNVQTSKTNLSIVYSHHIFPINSYEDYHKFENKIKSFEKLSYFDVFTFWWLIIISDGKLWVSPVFFYLRRRKNSFFFTFSSSQLRPEAKFHFLRFNKLLILMTRQGFESKYSSKAFTIVFSHGSSPASHNS